LYRFHNALFKQILGFRDFFWLSFFFIVLAFFRRQAALWLGLLNSFLDGKWVRMFGHLYALVCFQLMLELHQHKPPETFVMVQLLQQLLIVNAVAEL
jgi:hypothetical protein